MEAKSYDSPIDKDRIMKLIQIVNDIGADHGIIVTTSYFTPEAIMTAKGTNVESWDREQLLKSIGEIELSAMEKGLSKEITVKEKTTQPKLTIQDAEKIENDILIQRAKGGFLGRGKINEKLDSITLAYFPYYEVQVQASITDVEKTGFRSTRTIQKIVTRYVFSCF